jgi:hypothetical protein
MRFSVLLSCAFFVIALGVTPVRAHDIYTNVKNKQGASCCDNRDCRPVHYRIRPWGVQMLVDDSWRTISSEKLEYRLLDGDSGETNGGHWCGEYKRGSGWVLFKTHCAFVPPNLM